MKKTVTIKNIDCAHCAEKIERNVSKIDGIKSANLNFMMQKLSFECDDNKFSAISDEIKRIAKKIEPDCEIIGL